MPLPKFSGSCRRMATGGSWHQRRRARGHARYLGQIARRRQLGYYGVADADRAPCEDTWVVASAVAPLTQRLRFLVAVRPGLQSPRLAARMAATLDRFSNGRLLVNVVTGGDPVEEQGRRHLPRPRRALEITREFLNVWRELLAGETVDFAGKHVRIEGGRLLFPPVQRRYPPLYFGGSSDPGIDVAAEVRRLPDLGRAAGASRRKDRARGAAPPSAAARSSSASACT